MPFKATQEQQEIIDHVLNNNGLSAVNSVAGSGKTSLLVEITKQLGADKSGIYLAYNKSIATEAKSKFPKNISCSTTHSLAFRAVIMPNKLTVTPFINYRDIIAPTLSSTEKYDVTEYIKAFCLSKHVTVEDYFKHEKINIKYMEAVQNYLTYMETGEYPCTHDAYLKLFHLGLHYGKIEYDELDIILLDEAGDLNEVTLEIFKLLPAKKKIMVGDPHQNIYSFNYTINCFKKLHEKVRVFPMSQSFRVSANIAEKIEKYCATYLEPDFQFKGIETDGKIITHAYITRTNAELVSKMMELNSLGVQYGLVRRPDDIFALPLAMCSLQPGGFVKAKEYTFLQDDVNRWGTSQELRATYKSPLAFIRETYKEDIAIQISINLILSKGAARLRACHEEAKKHSFKRQSLILGTAHSTKGLEFDEVTIANDLNTNVSKYLGVASSVERTNELNLYYVACSRAKKQLNNATVLDNIKEKKPTSVNVAEIDPNG